MEEGFHPPVEEYLKAVYELEEEGALLIRARLAERLGHSAPTVTEAVRRLAAEGYLESRGRSLQLTDAGRHRAERVVRKHRLVERLLNDVIGLEWSKTHQEAGRWEHVISDETEQRLVEVLGRPSTCPHGNPIPGLGELRTDLELLADIEPGKQFRLERIIEAVEMDRETLAYLERHGLQPGAKAEVSERAPDGTLTLSLDGETIAVGPGLAGQLYVEQL